MGYLENIQKKYLEKYNDESYEAIVSNRAIPVREMQQQESASNVCQKSY